MMKFSNFGTPFKVFLGPFFDLDQEKKKKKDDPGVVLLVKGKKKEEKEEEEEKKLERPTQLLLRN